VGNKIKWPSPPSSFLVYTRPMLYSYTHKHSSVVTNCVVNS